MPSELVNITGAMGIPQGTYDRENLGEPVRIVIDGHLDGYNLKNTAHKGTEERFTVRGEACIILRGADAERFDNAVAEARAAAGEPDPRQGTLDGEKETDKPKRGRRRKGNVHDLPLGDVGKMEDGE